MNLAARQGTPLQASRRLWLVRHATPLIGSGVCYGALDVAADECATQVAAERLTAALPQRASVWTSTLQRCEQLAQVVQGLRPDFIIKPDARLTEMNFGRWEGLSWDAIGPAALQAWTDDFSCYAPGCGESVSAFMQRVAAAFDETCTALAPGQDAVWITHAGVIRAVDLLARGVRRVTRAAQWPLGAPDFGAWRILTLPD